MAPHPPSGRPAPLAGRLSAYAARAGGLALGTLAAAVPASDVLAQGCAGGTLQNGICSRSIDRDLIGNGTAPVDFDGDGAEEVVFTAYSLTVFAQYSLYAANQSLGNDAGRGFVRSGPYVRPLADGAAIGPAATFGADPGTLLTALSNGPWTAYQGLERFAGLRLRIDGTDVHYGWVRLRYDGRARLAVLDAAYHTTPNTAIEAGDTGAALPVELADFAARADGPAVVLEWRTLSETDNAGFEIQHRLLGGGPDGGPDGASEAAWQARAFVEGRGTTTAPQTYSHRLEGLAPGRHAFRLRQIDLDGGAAYSAQVELVVEVPGTHVLSPAWPNPFNPQARFALAVARRQHVRVAVYDVLGRERVVLHDGELAGGTPHRFVLEAADWPSGTYFYRATGEHFSESKPIVLAK